MARYNHFVRGLFSSYAAIGINIFYTLASVPLALHYLNKEEFGLWALVTQLSGYLMLLEFGMTGSVARSLSDHKDNIENGIYGNILRTATRVFTIQGGLVAILGVSFAWFGGPLLGLPKSMEGLFTLLMSGQAILSGLRLAFTASGAPLWCHQRLDLSNLATGLSLITAFAALWLGFFWGCHLFSILIASAIGSALAIGLSYIFCCHFNFYPTREKRGQFDFAVFRDLFHFGSGLFLMNLGLQLTSASQVIIVSRILGVEAAATWSICTKIFTMAQQFVSRIFDSSAGGLAEMFVRHEIERLKSRFRDLVSISAIIACAVGAGISLMNGSFVKLWTSGEVAWPDWNNYLLAAVLLVTSVTRCHIGLSGITKQILGMKYVYFIEGLCFVSLSAVLVPHMDFIGLLLSALVSNIITTGAYGVYRTADFFEIPIHEVFCWVARPFYFLAPLAGIFILLLLPSISSIQTNFKLSLEVAIFVIIIIPIIWIFVVGSELQSEIKLFFRKFGTFFPSKSYKL